MAAIPAHSFESMTPEDRASYLIEVFCKARSASGLEKKAMSLFSHCEMSKAKPVGPNTPDYETHYNTALAYVAHYNREG